MRHDFVNFLKSFKICFKQGWKLLHSVIKTISKFIGPCEDSIRGLVSPNEFYRIILLATSVGGGFSGFVGYIKNNYEQFIKDPTVVVGIQVFAKHCDGNHLTMAIFVLVFIGDYLRRKTHGDIKR